MKRRQFLLASASMAMGLRPASAFPLFEKNLGVDWRVPKATVIELWPAHLSLDLAGALAAVSEWSIPIGSRVVIRLEDGAHVQTEAIGILTGHGSRLSIIGNTDHPERCKLIWFGSSEGFYVGTGGVLGLINGVLLEQRSRPSRGLGSGFLADAGGVIQCGENVQVRGFYYGFQARFGGVITCAGTTSREAGDANYFAFNGGHINAAGAKARCARDDAKKLGFGFMAEYGGTINAPGAIAEGNAVAGFAALSNGVIRAYDSTARHNGAAGFYVNTGGTIVAHNALAGENCGEGFQSMDRPSGITGVNLKDESNHFSLNYCKEKSQ
jgi:hypothetical protein